MSDEVIIKVDRFHLWLIGVMGAVILFVFSGLQAIDVWDLQRRAKDRERLSNVEGQVKAISESLQHDKGN